jgi:hypothetical protein
MDAHNFLSMRQLHSLPSSDHSVYLETLAAFDMSQTERHRARLPRGNEFNTTILLVP